MVDACDSKSHLLGGEGSSPSSGTMKTIIVIVGQTTSGKSDLAVELSKEFNGEVVSCDSRQVYTGLDFGSGKITEKEMNGIRHHMLDVTSLTNDFSVDDFSKLALKKIDEIFLNNKVPILCGGTGFYINSILYEGVYAKVPKNKFLRQKLEQMDNKVLINTLQELDKERASSIDIKNKRRLIRAIEIAKHLGGVPKNKKTKRFNFVCIGLFADKEILKEQIKNRLESRWNNIKTEISNMLKKGVSPEKLMDLGLEYKFVTEILIGKKIEKEAKEKLLTEIYRYAKRQITYFNKINDICWFNMSENKKLQIQKIKKYINTIRSLD